MKKTPSRASLRDAQNKEAGAQTDAPAPAHQPWLQYSRRQRVGFVVVLFFVGAANNIDRNILGVLLPQIKAEFVLSDTQLGLLSGIVFALFYATLGLPIARWADRGHRPRILTACLVVWSAMTALCGLAQTFWQLMLARLGVGAGEAGALPTAQSLIADYFPPEKRAGAMAMFVMSAAMGYAGGLILGGWIAEHYGWRAAFLTVGIAGVVLGPLCLIALKEPRERATIAAPSTPQLQDLKELISTPAYRNIVYAIVIYFFMGYGAFIFIVSLLTRLFDMSIQNAGATFGLITVTGTVLGNVVGGFMANRLAKKRLTNLPRAAAWAMFACVPVYEFALSQGSIAAMAIPLVFGMFLQNIITAPMFSSLYLVCKPSQNATAMAVALLFANLIGMGMGPFLAGVISDHLAPTHGPAESLRISMMTLFLVMLAGGFFMLRAARLIDREEERRKTESG